jgi:hypothetical protein
MTTAAVACPGCGRALTIPRTGRPPRWCSKSCRQAGYRARQSAARAADQASWYLAQLATARTELNRASNELAGAYARMTDAAAAADGDVEVALRTGARWETGLHDAARALQAAAGRVAQLALDHRRAAGDYQDARAMFAEPAEPADDDTARADSEVGLRRTRAATSRVDETPNVVVGGEIDRDELFDAVDDLVELLRDLAPELPQAVAAALASPAAKLDAVFEQQAGDGPIDDLAAVAWALRAAAWACEAQLPGELAAAIDRRAAALQGPK